MICRAVSGDGGGGLSDDPPSPGEQAVNPSLNVDDSVVSVRTPSTSLTRGLEQQQRRVLSFATMKEGLLKASNFASVLCVLDCTILPFVTVVLPLFGIVAGSPAQMEWLHELGHQVALWFVLPVGGLATTLNYNNHRKRWIAALGGLGLTAVVGANLGCHAVHMPGALGHALHDLLHTLHHGILHRVTNLVGCGLLLTSNYLSHKQGGCRDATCTHKH